MIHRLSNGLRVAITRHSGHVTYCGILVDAGSRDEPVALPGLAHFVEHTVFKGTTRRSSLRISSRMESVGGELNAYTNKEGTTVYAVGPEGHEERGVELIADIVGSPTFPEKEIDREREVIVEEINSYLDNPSESIFDQYEELIFQGSRLAHNILGTPESVRVISGEDCRRFVGKFYNPANMVGFISSPANPEKLISILEKHWGRLSGEGERPVRVAPEPVEPFDVVRDESGHQAHTIMGTRIFSRHDPRRFALMLLNNYLGGPCMNSRLNQLLREKYGLVYTVDSFGTLMSDVGLFFVYFGCDRRSVDRCRRIVAHELDRLAQSALSAVRLDRIKRQYCGQILVNSDNRESMAMSQGKNLLHYGRLVDIKALEQRLWEVKAEEIREVAELLAPDRISRITLM